LVEHLLIPSILFLEIKIKRDKVIHYLYNTNALCDPNAIPMRPLLDLQCDPQCDSQCDHQCDSQCDHQCDHQCDSQCDHHAITSSSQVDHTYDQAIPTRSPMTSRSVDPQYYILSSPFFLLFLEKIDIILLQYFYLRISLQI